MVYISFDIGVKNLAVCILKYDKSISIIDWSVITLADTKKELKSVDELSERIFMALDEIVGKLKSKSIAIDMVLIENQPSNLNGIMKTVQYIIYTYFSLLKYWENAVNNVVFINASHKLKNHSYTPLEQNDVITHKKNTKGFTREKYKWNKATSIHICSQYINEDTTLKTYFINHKKKDDLSDSFLQAVSYIRSRSCKSELNFLDKITINDEHFLECVN